MVTAESMYAILRDESLGSRFARARIVRRQLAGLAAEFRVVHAQARLVVRNAPEEASVLVGDLIRNQFRFFCAMAAVEIRLALWAVGLAPASFSDSLQRASMAMRWMAAFKIPSPSYQR